MQCFSVMKSQHSSQYIKKRIQKCDRSHTQESRSAPIYCSQLHVTSGGGRAAMAPDKTSRRRSPHFDRVAASTHVQTVVRKHQLDANRLWPSEVRELGPNGIMPDWLEEGGAH